MGDEVIEDEPKAGPYKPYGPAPECDVLSTPRWHFALLGIWSIAYAVLIVLFKFFRGWFVLSLVVPIWVIFRHVPEQLMELGRAHRGVSLLVVRIPEVICGLKCHPQKGEPIRLGDWIAGAAGMWLISAFVGVVVAAAIVAKVPA